MTRKHGVTGLDCDVPANCHLTGWTLEDVAQLWQSLGVAMAD